MSFKLRILYLHGKNSSSGGRKPEYLRQSGYHVTCPDLPSLIGNVSDVFNPCLELVIKCIRKNDHDIIVASSFGAGIAMSLINTGLWSGRALLLSQAGYKYGMQTLNTTSPILLIHGLMDTITPIEGSRSIRNANPNFIQLVELNDDHALKSLLKDNLLSKYIDQLMSSPL